MNAFTNIVTRGKLLNQDVDIHGNIIHELHHFSDNGNDDKLHCGFIWVVLEHVNGSHKISLHW